MAYTPQIKLPATYIRGGTSKGVFFNQADLPDHAKEPGEALEKLLLRVIGSLTPTANIPTVWAVQPPVLARR